MMGNLFNVALLLWLLFMYPTNAFSVAGCIDSERRALLKLRASLVDKANRLASWTTGEDCCTWVGITCNNLTGHVEKLDLHNPIPPFNDEYAFDSNYYVLYLNHSLGGEINPSLLNLEHLQYLDLSSNDFSRIQIPTFLGSLPNLRYLNLSDAGFIGEIPYHFGNLSNLQYLDLSSSSGLYARSLNWISGLASLKSLDLSQVGLTQCHDWLNPVNMLPSLSSLKLRDCRLPSTASPALSFVNLTSLVSLDLGYNFLGSTTPFLLLNLSAQLSVLRLDYINLQGPIPTILEKLTSLTVLDLPGSQLSSPSLPNSLCNQTSLTSLNLGSNKIAGSLPLCLQNLTFLRALDLSFNKFGGEIPSELGHLKELTSLDLSLNDFNSSIPSSFGQLKRLESLAISHNLLIGVLSESLLAKLNRLELFVISRNYLLTFNVSSQWTPPFQLRYIDMSSIQIIGNHFPSWFQSQRNVASLSIRNASISGGFPSWFKTFCAHIKTLYLSNNKINGSLTSFPPDIQEIDLSNNLLTGPILLFDTDYTTNLSLGALYLANNQLSGSIPDYFCNLSSLVILSLANNQLTGKIPQCFGNFRGLQVLDLANNSFSGHIPSTLGNLEQLYFLHLNRNKFLGALPSSLKKLKLLVTLDLGENQLSDKIPEWIGKELSMLSFLRLQSNHFYGNLSMHLCQLLVLQVLNVAQNNLVGHIPLCFGNFSAMMSSDTNSFTSFGAYHDILENPVKGLELEYSSNLRYVKSISLSGNNITGEIPDELMNLKGLQVLSLSNNKLSGRIPKNIGNLKHLESLDLAMNELSGPIPPSLANIDTLSYVNLSFNNLEGRIPSGNHFDTLDNPSFYQGNDGLCGKPLAKSCPDKTPSKGIGPTFYEKTDDKFELLWFYAGMAPGFSVGLLGVFCLKKSRHHYVIGFVENICYRVWVEILVKMSQLGRKFN